MRRLSRSATMHAWFAMARLMLVLGASLQSAAAPHSSAATRDGSNHPHAAPAAEQSSSAVADATMALFTQLHLGLARPQARGVGKCNETRILHYRFAGGGIGLDLMEYLLALHYAMVKNYTIRFAGSWIWTSPSNIIVPSACQRTYVPAAETMQKGLPCYSYSTCLSIHRLPPSVAAVAHTSPTPFLAYYRALAHLVFRLSPTYLRSRWPEHAGLHSLLHRTWYGPQRASFLEVAEALFPHLHGAGFHIRRGDSCLHSVRPACGAELSDELRRRAARRLPSILITDSRDILSEFRHAAHVSVYEHALSQGLDNETVFVEKREWNRSAVFDEYVIDALRLSRANHISASFFSNVPRWIWLMTNHTTYSSTDALFCPFHMCNHGRVDEWSCSHPEYMSGSELGTLRNSGAQTIEDVPPAMMPAPVRHWVAAVTVPPANESTQACMARLSALRRRTALVY